MGTLTGELLLVDGDLGVGREDMGILVRGVGSTLVSGEVVALDVIHIEAGMTALRCYVDLERPVGLVAIVNVGRAPNKVGMA